MISKNMETVFNQLIQLDYYSAQLYQAVSNYFKRMNLPGMAHWLRLQMKEEQGHALQLTDHLIERGGVVQLKEIAAMPSSFGTPLEAWTKILEHEQYVTQNYQKAYNIAVAAQDIQSASLFQKFLDEQVDEEGQSMYIVEKLKMIGDDKAALLVFDEELGRRAG
ncbi:ferritin [Bacillus tianshenii]|nr:ferritin [Bacillus tianshenii]